MWHICVRGRYNERPRRRAWRCGRSDSALFAGTGRTETRERFSSCYVCCQRPWLFRHRRRRRSGGRQSGLDPRLVLFLQTGICGGFTTFSTFSLETLSLIENGKLAVALAYIALSIVLGILALLLAKHLVSGWE